MGGISIWQIIVILLVIVLVFGVGKLPAIGRDLGKALREFRKSVDGDSQDSHKSGSSKKSQSQVADNTSGNKRSPKSSQNKQKSPKKKSKV